MSNVRRRSRKLESRSSALRLETLEARRVLATFMVTNTGDSGLGSLRQALADADGMAGPDRVEFDASLNNQTINLTTSSLSINGDLVIDASNLDALTVDAAMMDSTPNTADGAGQRVIDVVSGDVELNGLTIQGGDITGSGGGIRTTGSLSIFNSHIQDNHAFTDGSAVAVEVPGGNGNVAIHIADSTFTGNGDLQSGVGGTARGGAVFVNFPGGGSGNNVLVERSTMTGNGHASETGTPLFGGAMYLYGTGSFTIDESTFDGNQAFEGSGGAVMIFAQESNVTVDESNFQNNQANRLSSSSTSVFGGAVYMYTYDSTATISNSTISGNTSEGVGGGIGVYANYYSNVELGYLAIINNLALTPDDVGYGGGINASSVGGSNVTLKNSTISGNSSGDVGGGGLLYLPYDGSTLTVENVTVANNSAAIGQGSMAGGGGLSISAQPLFEVTILNTILADNVAATGPDDLTGNVDADYSLIENLGVAVVNGSNNIFNMDPMLLPLADNGGSTLTHALGVNSPAIDAGDPNTTLPFDQRFWSRTVDGDDNGSALTDIGALEDQDAPNEPPVADVSKSINMGVINSPIVLDGTRSTDPEMAQLTYQWSIYQQPMGSIATIDDPTAGATFLTTDTAGLYRIELVVSDGVNDSAPVRFRIDVLGDVVPTPDVSLSQSNGAVGLPIAMNGSRSSDPQDDPLNYQWSIVNQPMGSNPMIANPNAEVTTWTTDMAGTYRVRLVVDDGMHTSDPIQYVVNVSATAPPTGSVSMSMNSGMQGQPIALNAMGSSDPGMNPLTYQWSIVTSPPGSNPIIADPTAEVTTWTPDLPGTYRVRLVVNNGSQDSTPVNFLTQVASATAPTADVSKSLNSGAVSSLVTIDGSRSTDPNMLPLTYDWSVVTQPNGSNFSIANPAAAVTTFSGDTAGQYRIRLVVNNGTEDSSPVMFLMTLS